MTICRIPRRYSCSYHFMLHILTPFSCAFPLAQLLALNYIRAACAVALPSHVPLMLISSDAPSPALLFVKGLSGGNGGNLSCACVCSSVTTAKAMRATELPTASIAPAHQSD